jgi:hypothetical protein
MVWVGSGSRGALSRGHHAAHSHVVSESSRLTGLHGELRDGRSSSLDATRTRLTPKSTRVSFRRREFLRLVAGGSLAAAALLRRGERRAAFRAVAFEPFPILDARPAPNAARRGAGRRTARAPTG